VKLLNRVGNLPQSIVDGRVKKRGTLRGHIQFIGTYAPQLEM
jgi:hypothetical protein